MLREITGPAGPLEALLNGPEEPSNDVPIKAAVVFGHPHPQFGGTMHTKGAYQSAKALARIGCAVLRFNFRGVGRSAGAFDDGAGEREDFRAGLDFMAARYPGTPLWAAGMSFGAWIGLTVGAEDPRVSLLLGVAAPVNKYDFGIVARSDKPKFFIHAELDELCSEKQIREFYASAADPKELAIIDSANHLFEGRVSLVGEAVEDLLGDWPG
jgi:alpha/beta superfamily hydrolase